MRGKGHPQEIAVHLLLVLILPLAIITIADAGITWLGLDFAWQDAVVLFAKAGVMINTALHPVPEKYNKGCGESINLFPEFTFSSRPRQRKTKRKAAKDKDIYKKSEPLPEADADKAQDVSGK